VSDGSRSGDDADRTENRDRTGDAEDDDLLGDAIDRAEPTDDQSATDAATSDTTATQMTDHSATDSNGGQPANESEGAGKSTIRRYVDYAILGGLLVLAFVAVIQFYLATGSAINTWINPEYRSLFRALFNLAVLLAVGAGVAYQLRRMDLGGSTGE